MNNKLILSLIVIFFTNMMFSQAPSIQWQKSLGGSDHEWAESIQQTTDGGYIVAGSSQSNDGDVTGNHGNVDYWIVKLDSSGTIQWQKSLGGSNDEYATSIQQITDGGYIVAGCSKSNDGDVTGNHGGLDYWIVKLDSSGTIQWQKSLGGSDHEWAESIQQTTDGGYIVAGFSQSNDGDVTGNHGVVDYWIVKLDSSGTIQWQKSLGGQYYDSTRSIRQTSDGGYIVMGYSLSIDGDVIGNQGSDDYWIVKLDSSGIIQWQKSLGGRGYDYDHSIQQTSDGGYIAVGQYVYAGDANYWIVKLDSSGTIQWQKSLGGSKYDIACSIQQTPDGSYIVAGYSGSKDGDVAGNHGFDDYWIVKLNSSGTIQWQKSLGGSSNDRAESIWQTSDGGYIVAGYSGSKDGDVTGNHNGSADYWVVKLAPEKLSTNEVLNKSIVFIENPVKDQFKIYTKEILTSLQLYNIEGKLIKTSNTKDMQATDIPKGIYVLKIKLKNGRVISEKIVKE